MIVYFNKEILKCSGQIFGIPRKDSKHLDNAVISNYIFLLFIVTYVVSLVISYSDYINGEK